MLYSIINWIHKKKRDYGKLREYITRQDRVNNIESYHLQIFK